MLIKANPDAIQSYLSDASHMLEGQATRVLVPENADEVAEILREATAARTPVTISGAGTGTVGGRIAFEGIVLATDRLNQIKSFIRNEQGSGSAVVEAGVRLEDFQSFVEAKGMFYPPDPTERSCFIGGTVATNASGARTFKYGPTRNYVERLRVALATGEVIDMRRGELRADSNGLVRIPLALADSSVPPTRGSKRTIEAQLPSYKMPQTRKHAAGYYVEPGMDLVDLFIGSEGTLGVILEAELRLLPRPEGLLTGVIFFSSDENLLDFVAAARSLSLSNKNRNGEVAAQFVPMVETTFEAPAWPPVSAAEVSNVVAAIDARALEYFDRESLGFLRQKYPAIPANAVGAILFEQEIQSIKRRRGHARLAYVVGSSRSAYRSFVVCN